MWRFFYLKKIHKKLAWYCGMTYLCSVEIIKQLKLLIMRDVIFQPQPFDWDVKSVPTGYLIDNEWRVNQERQTLVRTDTNMPLSVMSEQYCIFTNEQFMDFCNAISKAYRIPIKKYGTSNGGKRIMIAFDKGTYNILGHEIKNHCVVTSSHDGTFGINLGRHNEMIRCKNVWMSNRGAKSFMVIYHNRNMYKTIDTMVKEFELQFLTYDEDLNREIERLTRYADIKIDKEIINQAANYILNINENQEKELSTTILNKRSRLLESFAIETRETGMTGFGGFNGVTHFNTYNGAANGTECRYYAENSARDKYVQRYHEFIMQLA